MSVDTPMLGDSAILPLMYSLVNATIAASVLQIFFVEGSVYLGFSHRQNSLKDSRLATLMGCALCTIHERSI